MEDLADWDADFEQISRNSSQPRARASLRALDEGLKRIEAERASDDVASRRAALDELIKTIGPRVVEEQEALLACQESAIGDIRRGVEHASGRAGVDAGPFSRRCGAREWRRSRRRRGRDVDSPRRRRRGDAAAPEPERRPARRRRQPSNAAKDHQSYGIST